MISLNIEKIAKKYKEKTVLEDVSLSIKNGEVLGLLGPNGAGKTTLMKIVAGLIIPDKGNIEIFGINRKKQNRLSKCKIGLVPQENNMERELTVEECLLIYARLFQMEKPRQRVAEVIEEFKMSAWVKSKVDHLSGGMVRRALIARAMIPKPKLLLLDEPSVGLDPDMRQEVWQVIKLLKASGNTIVITTHYMEEAECLCDRIALLKSGRLLYMDTIENLKYIAQKSKNQPVEITLENAFLCLTSKEDV